MNTATESLRKGQACLAHEFNTVLEDAQDLLRHAGEETGKGYFDARRRLKKSVRAARSGLEDMEDSLFHAARLAARSADAYVREHPWKTIGVGATAALVVALLVARR